MTNSNAFPEPPPALPQPGSQNSTYQNPRSIGESLVDNDSTVPQVVLLKGVVAGTGISITSLADDIQINATGGGGTPDASETVKGVLELATQSETDVGTDDARAITALKLRNTVLTATQVPLLDVAKITTGVFPVARGGTGLSTLGANSAFYLRTNAGGTAMEWATVPPTPPISASEVTAGVARYATQGEVDTGTENNAVVRPNTLRNTLLTATQIPSLDVAKITTGVFDVARGGTGLSTLGANDTYYLRTNAGATAMEWATVSATVPSASESTAGILELATQVETDAGTDDARAITALKLRSTTFTSAQIPNLDTAKLTTGTLPIARGGTALSTLGTALQTLSVNSGATSLEYIAPLRGAFSRVAYVDSVKGDDSTGAISTTSSDAILPFQSFSAAVTAANAVSGGGTVVIYLSAGIYGFSSPITLNSNVHIVGIDASACIINYVATVNGSAIILGNNCRLEQLSITVSTTANINLTGIEFPSSSTTSSKLRSLDLYVTATGVGTGECIGIKVSATTGLDPYFTNIRASTIRTYSVQSGRERAIYIDGINGKFNCRDTVLWSDGIGGNCIAAETNATSSILVLTTSSCFGSFADVSQTVGSIILSSTCLRNGNVNGNNLSQCISTGIIFFADTGTIGTTVGPRYLRPGNAVLGNVEQFLTFGRPTMVHNLRVQVVDGGVGTRTYTITINKNNVPTALSVLLTGAAGPVIVADTTNALAYTTGDKISCQIVVGGSGTPTASDILVQVEIY